MTQEVDLRGNTIVADGFTGVDLADATGDAGDIVIGTALTSAGEGITIAADDTLVEALQAIIDEVDPA